MSIYAYLAIWRRYTDIWLLEALFFFALLRKCEILNALVNAKRGKSQVDMSIEDRGVGTADLICGHKEGQSYANQR